MASNKNRKLSGVVLTGALVAPAVMSAAQQNVASADFNSFLSSAKEWSSWALNGAKQVIKSAWTTTYGKIGLCALAAVGFCGVVYLLDKLIPDDEGDYFDYEEISFDNEEISNCNIIADQFKNISKKENLKNSLTNLLDYLNNTENTKDVSIKLLIAKKVQDEGNNKLQTKTLSKSACVRALKKTLDTLVNALLDLAKAKVESQSEEVSFKKQEKLVKSVQQLFSEKGFGEIFAGYLKEEGVEVNGVVAGFQIPELTKTVVSPKDKKGQIYSSGLNNFQETKVDKNHFFDESYKDLEIEPNNNENIEIKKEGIQDLQKN